MLRLYKSLLISSKFKFCFFEAFSQLKNIFNLHLVKSENLESVDPDGQLYVMDVCPRTLEPSLPVPEESPQMVRRVTATLLVGKWIEP